MVTLQQGRSGDAQHRRHEVTISNPGKVLFPKPKYTKLDLANYTWPSPRRAARRRRPAQHAGAFPNGIGAPSFYQKRAPKAAPPGSRW